MSEWKEEANKRREFRQSKSDPEVPQHKGKRKNTKKWCKGKVGVEHSFLPVLKEFTYMSIRISRCENCGKEKWS